MWIEFGESPIHGAGGFAIKAIPAGARVIEYRGRWIDKSQSLRECECNNRLVFYLNTEHDLDGNVEWNPARLLNHSCAPNCEAKLIEERIWIVATRDIDTGEEITFDYGFDLESFREHPCHCRAPQCVGYILAQEFHRMLAS